MRQVLFSILILAKATSGVAASCIDPATLVRSTVNITREFGEEERKEAPGVLGIRGTAWFLSSRLVVTAAHVAEAMHLSRQDWREIGINERESTASVAARILQLAGTHAEKMAVLELRTAFASATALPIRTEPLVPEERVVTLSYPKGHLRFGEGRFVQYGEGGRFVGAALMEIHDGNDRLVLDHGASGAPVLDCYGRVVAVVSTLITQTINLPTGAVRVSTAWQTPNVVSIPAAALRDFSALK
jgi:plasmid maintenance system antidote protein VapI